MAKKKHNKKPKVKVPASKERALKRTLWDLPDKPENVPTQVLLPLVKAVQKHKLGDWQAFVKVCGGLHTCTAASAACLHMLTHVCVLTLSLSLAQHATAAHRWLHPK